MPFDSPGHRDYLQTLKFYVSAPCFTKSIGWAQEGSSHMLRDKSDGSDCVAVVVGKVVNDRLFCGPQGNWSVGGQYGSLKSAKFQLTICRPDEDVFAKEYDVAFKTLGKVQAAIAYTTTREHLLIGEDQKLDNIRFSANVFETRTKPVKVPSGTIDANDFTDAVYMTDVSSTPPPDSLASSSMSEGTLADESEDTEKETAVDDVTLHWPVPAEMKGELHDLMTTHVVQPLPVYKGDKYVEPLAVNTVLKDALVEVHFKMRHYRIFRKESNKNTDSFTGLIEQIVILKAGVPRASSGYKRKNLVEGPYRPKPFRAASPRVGSSGASAGPSAMTILPNIGLVASQSSADGNPTFQSIHTDASIQSANATVECQETNEEGVAKVKEVEQKVSGKGKKSVSKAK